MIVDKAKELLIRSLSPSVCPAVCVCGNVFLYLISLQIKYIDVKEEEEERNELFAC